MKFLGIVPIVPAPHVAGATTVWASLLFWAGSLICLGFTVALAFEGWAVMTGHETISSITANAIHDSPWKAMIGVAFFFFMAGLLLAHFTNWSAN